jgi:hypothetical protein
MGGLLVNSDQDAPGASRCVLDGDRDDKSQRLGTSGSRWNRVKLPPHLPGQEILPQTVEHGIGRSGEGLLIGPQPRCTLVTLDP